MPFPSELLDSAARVARYVGALALTHCFDVWEEHGERSSRLDAGLCVTAVCTAAARMLGMEELARPRRRGPAGRARGQRRGLAASSSRASSDAVDASLLWLATPFGLVDADDPHFVDTVRVIEEQLTFEGGLRRYPTDTYYGSGAWPVLTASLGWHYAVAGDHAAAARAARNGSSTTSTREGRLAEQFGGERRDPATTTSGSSAGVPRRPTSPGRTRCTSCSAQELEAQAAVSHGSDRMTDGRPGSDPSDGLGQAVPE